MSIQINSGFKINSKSPIDDRLIMSLDEMIVVSDDTMPDSYLAICSDDKCLYVYNKSNTPSATSGKFVKVEGSLNVRLFYQDVAWNSGEDLPTTEDLKSITETGKDPIAAHVGDIVIYRKPAIDDPGSCSILPYKHPITGEDLYTGPFMRFDILYDTSGAVSYTVIKSGIVSPLP